MIVHHVVAPRERVVTVDMWRKIILSGAEQHRIERNLQTAVSLQVQRGEALFVARQTTGHYTIHARDRHNCH